MSGLSLFDRLERETTTTRWVQIDFVGLESQLIAWIHQNVPGSSQLVVGLGDDAAVLKPNGAQVVTTDLLTDGVDFLIEEVTPEQIGHKALGVNLSDLAAMAASPRAAFVSLVLPQSGTKQLSALDLAIGLYRGMLPLAQEHGLTIAGGDTNSWDGPSAISITAVGEATARGPLTRSGGQPGDQLLVTGRLGGSILGRHLQVEPRVSEALLLHEKYELHAGIDISDGLALDASRLAEASGLGAVLDLPAVPTTDAAHTLGEQSGRTALDHALADGEDFELLLAVPPAEAQRMIDDQPLPVPITRIGEFTKQHGLWQRADNGQLSPLPAQGFEHGADE